MGPGPQGWSHVTFPHAHPLVVPPSPVRHHPMELLERAAHLDVMQSYLREAAAGEGRALLLGGEAGAGKTVLVDRFCRLAEGRARTLTGACDALSTPRPLGPLLDI